MNNAVGMLAVFLFLTTSALGQGAVGGFVGEKDEHGHEHPLVGVNIYWQGSTTGTTSNADGMFSLPLSAEFHTLLLRLIGYTTDTLTVTTSRTLHVLLEPEAQKVDAVEVLGTREPTFLEYNSAIKTTVMTEKELFKAACCNLSESFQTNPSIDVSFTDAITGTKQIEMLGLSGIYTQTTLENMPYIRGLTSNVGLTYIPGTWIDAIHVSKGLGSVANGYESITGQIDVDLKKPLKASEGRFFANVYGNQDQRMEANLALREYITENLSSMTLFHYSSQQKPVDENGDGYLDMPLFTTLNAMQRWHYVSPNSWESQVGVQYVSDSKEGGTQHRTQPFAFPFGSENSLLRVHGKTGKVISQEHGNSLGVQWSYSRYKTNAHFGSRSYSGTEATGYLNVLYQAELSGKEHTFRTGLSFLFDQYDEQFDVLPFQRIERVPGLFFEYTYLHGDQLSVVAGLRVDEHNAYGTMMTPRLHIRYTPQEDWVLRFAAGRGYRTTNIFAENSIVFASARAVSISPVNSFAYGLNQEIAWNYGFNLTHYFTYNYKEATLMLDIYRTDFEQVVFADLDSNPRQVQFYSVANGAYSNSVQLELNMQLMDGLDVRTAYRYLDVKQLLGGVWRERPLTPQNRVLATLSYATEQDQPEDPKTAVDLTVQWFGEKRIPETTLNPENLRVANYSPDFFLVNMQLTRTLMKDLDVYLGMENLFDTMQHHPIVDGGNPNGQYFDASLIWGPLSGRMLYAGIRYRI